MIERWPAAVVFGVFGMMAAMTGFTIVDKSDKLLACLVAYVLSKVGIIYLTTKRGGWKVPGGFFIVWYSVAWTVYIGYIVQLQYVGNIMPRHWLDFVYANMTVSGIGAFLSFPWRDDYVSERERQLDARSHIQDQRGERLDRRGYGQDERAKLLTQRSIGIDARSDRVKDREGDTTG